MDWLWEDRLVEVWGAPGRADSGVAFGAAGVLTARHVVAEGSPVRVQARIVRRADLASAGAAAAPWVSMRVVAADPDWDLAVLEVDPDAHGAGRWQVPASAGPRLAAVSGAAEPACESVGFPDASVQGRASSRPNDRVRQSEQAAGMLLPMGQVKAYRGAAPMPKQVMPLDVVTATPEQAAKWGGMSGAGVVLADGRLAGIVVGVEPDRQARRLLVVPLAPALTSARPLQEALKRVSGGPLVIEPRQTSRARQLPAAHFIEQFLAHHLAIRGEFSIPFGGRDDELDRLSRWARDPAGPPCLVVSAPPGRGKSTLLARWWHQHRDGPVVFVPISIRYHLATEEDVLRALVARLAKARRADPAEPSAGASTGVLHDRLAEYLQLPAPAGRHLVIVVDGIDEASGWEPSRALSWPSRFGSGVRLLVAARQTEDLPDAASWREDLGWEPGEAATMDLDALTERGVGQVLDSLRPSLTPAQIAVRSVLFDLTGGDPLVVRLYLEDLGDAPDRDAWISALGGTDRPRGLDGYLRRWMADQERLWGGRLGSRPRDVGVVFSLLACAFAPLRRDHLGRLAGFDEVTGGDALDAAIAELRRFVVTDKAAASHVMSHPRIAEQRRDDLARNNALAGYDMIFVDHYRSQQPDWTERDWLAIDDYGLRHLTAHLRRAGRPELLHTLLRRERRVNGRVYNGWYHAKESAGQLDAYLADVREAWQLAGDFAEQTRYALYATSVQAGFANVPSRLLELCVRYRKLSWPQAIGAARARREPVARARALARLQPPLIPQAAWEEAARAELRIADKDRAGVLWELATVAPEGLVGEILAAAEALDDDHLRAGIVVGLATRLPNEDVDAAVRVARSLHDPLNRVRALAAIAAPALEPRRRDLLAEITDVINGMPDDSEKGLALCALARAEPDMEATVRDVFALAERLDDPWGLPQLLTELAGLEPDERLLTDALDLAERIYRDEHSDTTDRWYLRALIGVGQHLSPGPRDERAGQLINQMLGYTGLFGKASARGHIPLLAPLLRPEQRRKTLAGRISAAVGIVGSTAFIEEGWERTAALAALSDLPPDQLEVALRAVDRVADHDLRADILAVLLTQLDEPRRGAILDAELARVQALHDEPDQAYALAALVPQLPDPERTRVAGRAVEIAGPPLRDAKHAELIGTLAPHLLDDVLDAVLGMDDGLHRDWILAALVAALPEANLAVVEKIAADNYLVAAALAARRRWVADEALRRVGRVDLVELPDNFLFVLDRLAQHLTSSGRTTALTMVDEVLPFHPEKAAQALALLAPHLRATERDIALAAAGRLEGPPYVTAVSALAGEEHNDALRHARAVADSLPDGDRAEAMAALAPFPEYRPAALAAALKVEDDLQRSRILARIAPHLDTADRRKALAAMLQCYSGWPNSSFRNTALRATLLTRIAETAGLGGEGAAPAVARAILDATRWWP